MKFIGRLVKMNSDAMPIKRNDKIKDYIGNYTQTRKINETQTYLMM